MQTSSHSAPGFVRVAHIVGDPRRGILPLIPISRSAWWAGVANGTFPTPVKYGRTSMWRLSEILELAERIEKGTAATPKRRQRVA